MSRFLSLLFIASVIPLLLTSTAFATILPASTRCDLSGTKLPQDFRGHKITDIFGRVSAALSPKDEFETLDAFELRLAADINSAIDGVDEFCIVNTKSIVSYDADEQRYWVGLFIDYQHVRGRPWIFEYHITGDLTKKRLSSYDGVTALGVSTPVSKTEASYSVVAFDAESTRPMLLAAGAVRNGSSLSFPYDVSTDQARSLKGKIGIAAAYRLVAPFAIKRDHWERPTLDMPFEQKLHESVVAAEITHVALFNIQNGEVLAKFDIAHPREAQPDVKQLNSERPNNNSVLKTKGLGTPELERP